MVAGPLGWFPSFSSVFVSLGGVFGAALFEGSVHEGLQSGGSSFATQYQHSSWVNISRDSETVNVREWVGAYSDRSLRDV